MGISRLLLLLIVFNIAYSAGAPNLYPQEKGEQKLFTTSIQSEHLADLDTAFVKRPCKPFRHSWYPCFDPCHSGNCYYAHCISLFAFHKVDNDSLGNEEVLLIRRNKRIDPDLTLEKRPPKTS